MEAENRERMERKIKRPLRRREAYRHNIRRQTEKARYNMRKGMMVVIVAVLLLSVQISRLLFSIAVTEHRKYSEIAANTHTAKYPVYPARGNIYDSNGKVLALSTYTYTVGITPRVFGPRRNAKMSQSEAETQFCKLLGIDLYGFRKTLIDDEDKAYVVIKRTINAETNERLGTFLSENDIGGVVRDAVQARYYPQGDLAAKVIGFANKRDDALAGVVGVEAYYNSELAGTAGYVYRQVDNYWSQALPNTAEANVPAVEGRHLVLTLQSDLQRKLQSLSETLGEVTQAENGVQAIVMDPSTGAILAMAGEVSYDLNDPTAKPANYAGDDWDPNNNKEQQEYMSGTLWTDRATHYPYEVGSVMKPFVLGAAMDEGKMTLSTPVDDSFVYVDGWPYPISSYDNRSRGILSPAEAIWDSRNPPFVRIADWLGLKTFYKYIDALGVKQRTGVDIPGETVGLFHETPGIVDMAVTSFGEQVTITPLQMANAYVMLANGGTLIKPHVAKQLLDSQGNVVREFGTEPIRRVLSEETCRAIRRVLIGTGRYGTGRSAYVPGLENGYKTGTSSRAVNGSEADNSYSHTTVCLLPAENPKYVIYMTSIDYGDFIAPANAVMVRELIKFIAERDHMPLQYKTYDYNLVFRNNYPEDVVNKGRDEARKVLLYDGFNIELSEGFTADKQVKSQYPRAGLNMSYDATLWLSDKENDLPKDSVILPDFVGLTAEEARREAAKIGINVSLNGTNLMGKVTQQSVIDPELAGGKNVGDPVKRYSLVLLEFAGYDQLPPENDGSLEIGYPDGSGGLYGG